MEKQRLHVSVASVGDLRKFLENVDDKLGAGYIGGLVEDYNSLGGFYEHSKNLCENSFQSLKRIDKPSEEWLESPRINGKIVFPENNHRLERNSAQLEIKLSGEEVCKGQIIRKNNGIWDTGYSIIIYK